MILDLINNDMIMIVLIVVSTYVGFKLVNAVLKIVAYGLIIVYFASKLGLF